MRRPLTCHEKIFVSRRVQCLNQDFDILVLACSECSAICTIQLE